MSWIIIIKCMLDSTFNNITEEDFKEEAKKI